MFFLWAQDVSKRCSERCSLSASCSLDPQSVFVGVPGAGSLPRDTLSSLSSLQSLDLSFTGCALFPSELLGLRGTLRVLNLSNNRIASLPEEVAGLTR